MNLVEDPYFGFAKEVYQGQRERINEEFKLRNEWIQNYSDEPKLDTEVLKEWKVKALEMLNHSNVSPAARAHVKQYLAE